MTFKKNTILIIGGWVIWVVFFLVLGRSFLMVPDGAGYFSQLLSVFEDGDLFFGNEYRAFGVDPRYNHLTDAGYIYNPFPCGSAILWTPFYLLGKVGGKLYHARNGFNEGLWCCAALGSAFYGFLALLILRDLLSAKVSQITAWMACLFIILGTPFAIYNLWLGLFSHACSAFAVGLFFWIWLKYRENGSLSSYIYLGIAGGLMALVRWQDIGFIILPLCDFVADLRSRHRVPQAIKRMILFCVAFAVTFLPQMLIWFRLYGSPLLVPQQSQQFQWLRPEIVRLLFSTRHGLFIWTPLYLLIAVALTSIVFRKRSIGIPILLALIFQIYVNASFNWHGSFSFGVRRFVSSTVPCGFVLGLFLEHLKDARKWVRWSILLSAGFCVVWTLSLMTSFLLRWIPTDEWISLKDLLSSQVAIIKEPFSSFRSLYNMGGVRPWDYLLLLGSIAVACLAFLVAITKTGNETRSRLIGVVMVLSIPYMTVALRDIDPAVFQTAEQREALQRISFLQGQLESGAESSAELHAEIANIYASIERWDRTVEHLLEMEERDGNDPALKQYLAFALIQLERYEEAFDYAAHASMIAEDEDPALFLAGLSLSKMETFHESLDWLSRVSSGNSEWRNRANVIAAYCYYRLGHREEALRMLRSMKKDNPLSYEEAQRYLIKLTFRGE